MLLAIDTATRTISLALHDGRQVTAETTWHTANYHTVELAPQTALLMRRAGIEPAKLQGVAVALGPGSYTGLRIGLGLAKGLVLAHQLPLIGVPTFDILMRAQPPRDEKALAILQAGRHRILVAAYRWHKHGWQMEGEMRGTDWHTLASGIVELVYVCGEIDAAGFDLLHQLKDRVTLAPPAQGLRRAGYLAEIGWERLHQRRTDSAATLAPIYLGQTESAAP